MDSLGELLDFESLHTHSTGGYFSTIRQPGQEFLLPISFCLLFTVEMFGIFSHQLDFSLIYRLSNYPFRETRRYTYVP